MHLTPNKIYPFLLLVAASVPLFFIGIRDAHAWGDDYAQYILEARNITEGKPYHQSGYLFNELNTDYAPQSYPPGFPVLLAPVIKFYGISIRPMLYFMTLVIVALLFVVYLYFRKYMGVIPALCLSVCGVYSGCILNLKWHILSDIPFLLFTSMYLLLRHSEKFSMTRILLISGVGLMALLIRSQGFILLLAEALYFMTSAFAELRHGTLKIKALYKATSIKIISCCLLAYLLVTRIIFAAPGMEGYYTTMLTRYPDGFWQTIWGNVLYLADLLKSFPGYSTEDPFFQKMLEILAYSVLALALIGFGGFLKKGLAFHTIFFLLCCLLILQSPVHQGLRFLLPAWPLYLLYAAFGVRTIFAFRFRMNFAALAVVLSLLYLAQGFKTYGAISYQPDWTPYNREDSLMFDHIRKVVKKEEVIVFSKPRALTLYTGKKTINFAWQVAAKDNKQKFDQVGVRYVLRRRDLEELYVDNFLREIPCAIDSMKVGEVYTLYTIR